MPVNTQQASGFFIIENGKAKRLSARKPEGLDRRTAFGIPLWALVIMLPGGDTEASTFRASDRAVAVSRARNRVEREKIGEANLAKFAGRRRSDRERIFEDVLNLRFRE